MTDLNARGVEAAVEVKPLEWRYNTGGALVAEPSGLCRYIVSPSGRWYFNSEPMGKPGSEEKAKAAAQADYESRILSTLSPRPAGDNAGVGEAAHEITALRNDAYCDTDKGPMLWKDICQYAFDTIEHLRRVQLKAAKSEADALRKRVAELEATLKPFADKIFNDNGDITVDLSVRGEDLVKAYFLLRRAALTPSNKKDPLP